MKQSFFILGYVLTFGYYSVLFYHPIITVWPFSSIWLMTAIYIPYLIYLMAMDKLVVENKYSQSPSLLWVFYYPGYLVRRRHYLNDLTATILGVILNIVFLVGVGIWTGILSYEWLH